MSNKDPMLDVIKSVNDIRALAESKAAETVEVKNQIKALGDDAAAKFEAIQKTGLEKLESEKALKAEVEKLKADYTDLYKKANRLGAGSANEEEIALFRGYSSEMDQYLRKGVEPTDESLGEIAHYLAKKSFATQNDAKINSAKQAMLDEFGGNNGYLLFDKKAMVAGSNPDGGYLTMPDYRTDLTVTRIFETSPMRAIANIITTTSGEVEIPIDDNQNTSGGWVGEIQARTDTANAKVGMLSIAVHEQYAQPKASQKMLDDGSINIEQWLANKTSDILRRTENTAFVSGDGASKPKGFLSYAAWASAGVYERGKLERVLTGTSATMKADSLIALQNALLEDYQARAVFLMQRTTFGVVSQLKTGTGEYLLNPTMLPQGATLTLLGKPVIFASDMQAIAADSLSVAYGDFDTGYTIVDRLGIRVLRDPFTDKPNVKFYTTKRVGGAVTNYQCVKILQLT